MSNQNLLILLENCNLEGINFSDIRIEYHFKNCSLKGIKFKNSKLEGAVFENSDLTDADFEGAILNNVKFIESKLYNINFKNATFTETKCLGSEQTKAISTKVVDDSSYSEEEKEEKFLIDEIKEGLKKKWGFFKSHKIDFRDLRHFGGIFRKTRSLLIIMKSFRGDILGSFEPSHAKKYIFTKSHGPEQLLCFAYLKEYMFDEKSDFENFSIGYGDNFTISYRNKQFGAYFKKDSFLMDSTLCECFDLFDGYFEIEKLELYEIEFN